MVAWDENVVALTLAAPDRAAAAALASRLAPGHPSAQRPDPAVLAVRRAGPAQRLPHRGAPHPRRRRGLDRGARRAGRRGTVSTGGPRNAFPFAVRLRLTGAAGAVRRRRDRHHPILPMLALADRLGVDWSMVTPAAASTASRSSTRCVGSATGCGSAPTTWTGCPTPTICWARARMAPPSTRAGRADADRRAPHWLAGRDDVELHFERFAAAPVVDGAAFTVTAAGSGRNVTVAPDETLLAALQRAGVAAPYSCRQGFCGTCRARALEGVVQHRDTLLTEPERADGMILTCVSRAAGANTWCWTCSPSVGPGHRDALARREPGVLLAGQPHRHHGAGRSGR